MTTPGRPPVAHRRAGSCDVRIANLACVGSQNINGVAKLHTDLLKSGVLRDFVDFSPEKFTNVTNGVTPRRFLLLSNPGLAGLITRRIGNRWIKLDELQFLRGQERTPPFEGNGGRIELGTNRAWPLCFALAGLTINPDTLFDIQAKRIHEYKRQHLNPCHIAPFITGCVRDLRSTLFRRTFIFSGKAAPGYDMAKLIIN